MSIIYNNQVVAGKYTQQVVADADTVNAGIIKLATEEQVIEGVDNTTAITPFYLAQKQDKISAGDGIVIDNNEISCTVNPDEQTIVRKNNGTMQCIGQITKSNTLKFDWEGTQAEYNVAYLNGTIQPDWYCYITDDESIVDYGDVANQSLSNLKQEGEDRFNNKANIDLDNLSSVGQSKLDIKADKATTLEGYGITDGLNKNQITNCITEIPQRIKLELVDGTLTLKAGSKVIVPNGFEADGTTPKFDEVVVESDVTYTRTNNNQALIYFNPSNNKIDGFALNMVTSGATPPTNITTTYWLWYDTVNNLVKKTGNNGSTWENVGSLPIGLITVSNDVISSIDQVFNGMGYIGSTVWVDKEVKGLIPNGRNEDGTLKNIEFVTNGIFTHTKSQTSSYNATLTINSNSINSPDFSAYLYDEQNNINKFNGTKAFDAIVGFVTASSGTITYFQPKQPFRAIDYSDKSEVSGWGIPSSKVVTLTPGASGTRYTAPANGWVRCWGYKNTADVGYVQLFAYGGIGVHSYVPKGWGCGSLSVPVRKGQQFGVEYYNDISEARLEFRYTQGEV